MLSQEFLGSNENYGYLHISSVESDLMKYTDQMYDAYLEESHPSEVNNTLNHMWYSRSSVHLQNLFEKFQHHPMFHELCHGSSNCKIQNVKSMDEIMYSNSKQISEYSSEDVNYYGATSNYKLHHDCEICSYLFPNTKLYRVLIGLTNNNYHIYTHFPEYNVSKNINAGDVVAFDFDRTLHKVVNEKHLQTSPRALLKLHYLVCEDCQLSESSFQNINQFYIYYDRFLRGFTKIGTDPVYPHEYAIGLTCHYYYKPNMILYLFLYFLGSSMLIKKQLKYQTRQGASKTYKSNVQKNVLVFQRSLLYLFCIYGFVIISHWASFRNMT